MDFGKKNEKSAEFFHFWKRFDGFFSPEFSAEKIFKKFQRKIFPQNFQRKKFSKNFSGKNFPQNFQRKKFSPEFSAEKIFTGKIFKIFGQIFIFFQKSTYPPREKSNCPKLRKNHEKSMSTHWAKRCFQVAFFTYPYT